MTQQWHKSEFFTRDSGVVSISRAGLYHVKRPARARFTLNSNVFTKQKSFKVIIFWFNIWWIFEESQSRRFQEIDELEIRDSLRSMRIQKGLQKKTNDTNFYLGQSHFNSFVSLAKVLTQILPQIFRLFYLGQSHFNSFVSLVKDFKVLRQGSEELGLWLLIWGGWL